ncbi:cilia- and flagella-associated protein 73 isoform X1 [Taeniopygia guttata]|uniref:cilia- and flagella-associated protein 73 isoform X1 n=1 Tax=Taeniopygia guttata TaxID=59729 RepID=UPI003BB8A199
MSCVPRDLGLCSHLRVPRHWVGVVSPAEAPGEERTLQPWAAAGRGIPQVLTTKLRLWCGLPFPGELQVREAEVGGVGENMNAGRAKPVWLLPSPARTGQPGQAPRAEPRGTVADALPRLSLRSPAELHAARGRTAAPRDLAALPASTRVLLKRREAAEVERQLQTQRQEFQQRMQRLAQRRQQLARRQEQHRGAVLRFDSFLKAVAARRERALRRAGEERARAAAERAEAARLHRELERLRRHRERLARRLRSLRPFGDYLRDVLATMGQFQDVPAMLVHFGVLAGVRAALAREAEAGQEQLAQGRAQLQRYRQESSTQLLGTRNELARLQARLEAARRDGLQWESRWTHIQNTAIQKTLLLGQIKLAVLNLFQQTTAQLRIPMDRAQEDTKAQLDMLLLCMRALADICATGPHPQHHRSVRLLQGQE